MGDERYKRCTVGMGSPVLQIPASAQAMYDSIRDDEIDWINQLGLFLIEATEHIAYQLVPIYQGIINATSPDSIINPGAPPRERLKLSDLVMHEREVVRFAAWQKLERLAGRHLKIEQPILNPTRWPGDRWKPPHKPGSTGL